MKINLGTLNEPSQQICNYRKSEATTNQTISQGSDQNIHGLKNFFESSPKSFNPYPSPNDKYFNICDNEQFQDLLNINPQKEDFYLSDEEQ